MANGWQRLGELLGGGRDDSAFRARMQQNIGMGREELALRRAADEMQARQALGDALAGFGYTPEQAQAAHLAVRAGVDPRRLTGARGHLQEQELRGLASGAGIRRWGEDNPNAYLVGLAPGPVALPMQMGTGAFVSDRFAPAEEVTLSPLGEAAVGLTQARTGAARAQQFASEQRGELARAKRERPQDFSSATRGGGAAVYRFRNPETGLVEDAVSADGRTYRDQSGNVRQLPPESISLSQAAGATSLALESAGQAWMPIAEELTQQPAQGETYLEQQVRAASGPFTRIGLSPIVSGAAEFAGMGPSQQSIGAETYLEQIQQELKSAIGNNPRHPQWQEILTRGLIPRGTAFNIERNIARANQIHQLTLSELSEVLREARMTRDPARRRALDAQANRLINVVKKIEQGPSGQPMRGAQQQRPAQSSRIADDVEELLRREGL